LTLLACGGGPAASRDGGAGSGAGAGAGGAAGVAGADAGLEVAGLSADGGADAAPEAPAALDPGVVGLRLLTDAEYGNTMADLLGVAISGGQIFQPTSLLGSPAGDFDNLAGASDVATWRLRRYLAAAVQLTAQAFADPALAPRILTCAPAGPDDTACDARIVADFGLRAWRRPLEDDEVAGLAGLARAARGAGATFPESIARVVEAMLVSESFLYRIELDPAAALPSAHALTPYELAARLSYTLWSTMPDATLFALAGTGELARDDVLTAQVTRMLADPRATQYVRNFAGQWLGFRALDAHEVDVAAFPAWNDDLRRAMSDEATLFVSEYVQHDRSLTGFLTDGIHFVDDALAGVYGLPAPGSTGTLVRVDAAPDGRKGVLGLAAFLTATSNASTTSPSRRGATILEQLLCVDIGPTPASGSVPPAGTPREQLATLAQSPSCAGCHLEIDQVGLGLETFDAIGQLRAKYAPSDFLDIDPTGVMPDGTTFVGLSGLADLVQRDPRFLDCAARKALEYAIGRTVTIADGEQLTRIRAAWERAGLTFRGLLGAIVVSDAFRLRRGEGP
jgi:hypothetical protein